MYIKRLALENFRVYPELQIDFSEGLTVLVGPNASGKTSILEAIHLLATSKSHRTYTDRELVRFGTSHARLQGTFVSRDRELTISAELPAKAANRRPESPTSKKMEVDGRRIERLSELIGRVPAVIFSNDDLQIVRGSPDVRRRFLNVAISQLRPRYLDDLQRYRRALQQRNEVLKQVRDGHVPGEQIEPWSEQLTEAGARIARDRQEFIETLDEAAGEIHDLLTGAEEKDAQPEEIVVEYKGIIEAQRTPEKVLEEFTEQLQNAHRDDIRLGYTTVGPHRDDFDIRIAGKDARTFGSQGQQRTAALSLKIAQADVVRSWRGEPPLLLLDDCLSELDEARSRRILQLAEGLQGLIITSPVMTDLLAQEDQGRFYRVEDAQVTQMQP